MIQDRPIPRRVRPKLFRGQNKAVWERRLVEQYKWPPDLARVMAGFLVGQGVPPTWVHADDLDYSRLVKQAED